MLEAAIQHQPHVRFILWIRTNVVKMGVSTHGQKSALEGANFTEVDKYHKENLNAKWNPNAGRKDPKEFLRKCQSGIDRNNGLLQLIPSAPEEQRRWLTVYYEEMQLDTTGQMQRILQFLNLRQLRTKELDQTPSVKLSGEDLREKIENFDELLKLLEIGKQVTSTASCLQKMLSKTKPYVFRPCKEISNEQIDQILQLQ